MIKRSLFVVAGCLLMIGCAGRESSAPVGGGSPSPSTPIEPDGPVATIEGSAEGGSVTPIASEIIIDQTAPVASADPVEAAVRPLDDLAGLGDFGFDSSPEGGGSIRAKKEVNLARRARLDDPRNVAARVESAERKQFPIVALRLRVLKPAAEGAGATLERNAVIVVIPRLSFVEGRPAMQEPETSANAGAYYLRKGDRVRVRLGEQSGGHWKAEYLERE